MNSKFDRTGGVGLIKSGKTQQHLICISFGEAMKINPSLKFTYKLKDSSLIITFNQILGEDVIATVKKELSSDISALANQVITTVSNDIETVGKLNNTVVTAVFK